ncbi:MAG: hypothetical protein IPG05_07340 [Gemmatimonadetes bacterium]|nr:hypothetical protein [Gemmatimonadota bacterium]
MFLAHCLCIMLVPSLMWAQSPVRDSAGVTMVRTVPVATTPVVVSRQASRVITVGADVDVVGALRMSDGTIWIADAAARKLWRVGAGNARSAVGDWTSIYGMLRAGADSLLVWDGAARQARILDRTGRQRGSSGVRALRDITRPNGSSGRPALLLHGMFRDGSLLGEVRDPYRDGRVSHVEADSAPVVVVGRSGSITAVDTVLRMERVLYRGARSGMNAPLPFGRSGQLVAVDDGYLYSDGAAYRIEEHGQDGALRRVIQLARPLQVVTPAEIARFKAARLATIPADLRAEYAAGLDWLPWPARKGGWTALQRDAAGRLWARQWATDDEDATWDLFSPDGRHLGTTTVPAGVTVLDIGRDYLLGVAAGARGVEVRVYGTTWDGR